MASVEQKIDEQKESPEDVAIMAKVWSSFFNQVFDVAEEAVRSRKIPLIDVKNEEPYLFLGLIGATVFKCAQRSASLSHDNKHDTELRLADDVLIDIKDLPEKHRDVFQLLKTTSHGLYHLRPDLQWQVEQMILYGQSEHKVVTSESDGQISTMQRKFVTPVNNVAIYISQQSMFRDNFKNVLSLILSVYREV